ncbi:FxsA family protein [Nocardioides sp. Bht2]|uniref:FxsA family protein n=1 Tax=Nocardioides sp. Bht2 TaxID=3392297 RepID=UPI0039B4F729
MSFTSATAPRRRRRIPLWVMALLFLVIPLLELWVLIQVGQVIGVGWTILLLIADSVLGGWLIKREGARAFRALSVALSEGRLPSREIADGILVLAGGILMLSPGFVLDVVGLVLVLPVTRPLARRLLTRVVEARLLQGSVFGAMGTQNAEHPRSPVADQVIEGEVVDPPQ